MKKTLIYIFYILVAAILVVGILLIINSRGKTLPFLTNEGKVLTGSIAVIETVSINGLDQRMIIRGSDTSKPVLLYLHGGPGDPEFPFVHRFNPAIENLFVVCYWDQRGAGLSYSKDIPSETMTLPQFVDDAGKVTQYLLKKFKREKIYLLGHSWGTMLGSYTAKKFPECYYAFISVGQVGNQQNAEKLSYDFILNRARELNDVRALDALDKIGPPPYENPEEELKRMITERKYIIKYGGAVKKGGFYPRAAMTLALCNEYTLIDKFNYLRGMNFTKSFLWSVVMKTNLFKTIPSQKIPVYILQGAYDYQTTYEVAKEYYDSLSAPIKRFYTFENSAHSPIFEEPEKFERILKEILAEQKDTE
jgi:pimeloyl-ACP methyl ester carboxylesterase